MMMIRPIIRTLIDRYVNKTTYLETMTSYTMVLRAGEDR